METGQRIFFFSFFLIASSTLLTFIRFLGYLDCLPLDTLTQHNISKIRNFFRILQVGFEHKWIRFGFLIEIEMEARLLKVM